MSLHGQVSPEELCALMRARHPEVYARVALLDAGVELPPLEHDLMPAKYPAMQRARRARSAGVDD